LKRLSEQDINAIDVDVKGGVRSEKKDDGAADTKKPKTLWHLSIGSGRRLLTPRQSNPLLQGRASLRASLCEASSG
jgi:hypothetical protein